MGVFMTFSNFLLERILVGEFSFGFELEAIYDPDDSIHTNDSEKKSQLVKSISQYFPTSEKNIIEDGSVKGVGFPFEWASPVLQLNSSNIQKAIGLLSALKKIGVYTNNTCGFHIHYSYPNYKHLDGLWILCHLSVDPDALKKFLSFQNIDFTNERFASVDYLDDLARVVNNLSSNQENPMKDLLSLFNEEKYRLLRLHPQGTIEWRGPRTFLDNGSVETITNFFKRVWWVAHTFSEIMSRTNLHGIPKNTFYQELLKLDSSNDYLNKSKKNSVFVASNKERRVFLYNIDKLSDEQIAKILSNNIHWLDDAPLNTPKYIKILVTHNTKILSSIYHLPATRIVFGDDDLQYNVYKRDPLHAVSIPGLIPEIQESIAEKYPVLMRHITEPDEDVLIDFIKKEGPGSPHIDQNTVKRWLRLFPDLKQVFIDAGFRI